MGLSDQELVQTIVAAQTTFQETVCHQLQTWNQENKEAQRRIHERLDQLLAVQAVPADTCEQRRNACKACMRSEIKSSTGCPPWMVAVAGVGASLITGMAMFIITHPGG